MPEREPEEQTLNPWTVVNHVFEFLVDQGLRPTIGGGGDPGAAASDLLRALEITPTLDGDARIAQGVQQELADLRAAMDEAQSRQ